MGQEIVYCFKCQERIVTSDYAKGLAYELENNSCCSGCAGAVLETLAPKAREQLIAKISSVAQKKQSKTSGALKAIGGPPSASATRKVPLAIPPAKSSTPLIAGIAVAVVVVIALAAAFSSSSPPPPPVVEKRVVPPTPTPVPPPGPTPEEQRRSAAAKQAMQKARDFTQSSPKELHGQVREWKAALAAALGTGYEAEAKRELDRAEQRVQESMSKEIADLDRRVRERTGRKDFKGASALVAEARLRSGSPEWTSAFASMDRAIQDAAAAFETAWIPIFDGKTTNFMSSGSVAFWTVEDGALVRAPGQTGDQAGQSRDSFGDAEIRFRVSIGGPLSLFSLSVRQQDGSCRVTFLRDAIVAMGEGDHEVIVTCRGTQVTATLDGKPAKVEVQKQLFPQGRIQFNGKDGRFKVLAIEYRLLP